MNQLTTFSCIAVNTNTITLSEGQVYVRPRSAEGEVQRQREQRSVEKSGQCERDDPVSPPPHLSVILRAQRIICIFFAILPPVVLSEVELSRRSQAHLFPIRASGTRASLPVIDRVPRHLVPDLVPRISFRGPPSVTRAKVEGGFPRSDAPSFLSLSPVRHLERRLLESKYFRRSDGLFLFSFISSSEILSPCMGRGLG